MSTRTARATVLGLLTAVLAGALAGVVAPVAVSPTPARADVPTSYGAPSWWRGDCDTDNWTPRARAAGWTGQAAGRLGGQVLGIPVCGPRNLAGAPNIGWSRPGWGELEWQCVEFAMRFMVQVYGVTPYGANGVDVVDNYRSSSGGGLVRVDNGTAGRPPSPGDIVSFSSPSNVYGHVAVVASTSIDGNGTGTVRLATQNDTPDGWRTLTIANWKLAAFGSLYPYAWLHDPLGRGGGTGTVAGDTSVSEGSLVAVAGTTYRIAGGAPLVVTSPAAAGATGAPVVTLTADRLATLRAVPRDGTFLRDPVSGARWRVVGGAALPVPSCTATGMNGCAGSVDVDVAAVRGAGGSGVYSHLLTAVADGAFLRVADDGAPGLGTLFRAAGGALFPVDDCDDLGGCGSWVDLPAGTVAAYRAAHPTAVDGTVVRLQPSARLATWTAGRCDVVAAVPAGWTDVPDRAVSCRAPLVVSVPVGGLVQGRPTATSLTASGGSAPYRWAVTSGQLPAGTTLGPDGSVSGTPSVAGLAVFAVRVTDATGATASASVSWSVAGPVSVTAPATGTFRVGSPLWVEFAASGGSGTYTWAVLQPLPAGLVLTSDGLLAGTPRVAGTTQVQVRATDSAAPSYGAVGTVTIVVSG